MKLPGWLMVIVTFLGGVVSLLLILFRGKQTANDMATVANAEKEKIAAEIKADSDAELAARFNNLMDGGKK